MLFGCWCWKWLRCIIDREPSFGEANLCQSYDTIDRVNIATSSAPCLFKMEFSRRMDAALHQLVMNIIPSEEAIRKGNLYANQVSFVFLSKCYCYNLGAILFFCEMNGFII